MTSERPTLAIDLSGPDGNVFMVIGHARSLLTGHMLEHFNHDIRAAMQPGADKEYADILAITNKYVRLVDTSGTYPEYTLEEDVVIRAIEHLNQQIQTLSDTVSTLVEDLWPEVGSECGLKNYVGLLEQEIERTGQEVELSEPYQKLQVMLQECLTAIRQVGAYRPDAQAEAPADSQLAKCFPMSAITRQHLLDAGIEAQYVERLSDDDMQRIATHVGELLLTDDQLSGTIMFATWNLILGATKLDEAFEEPDEGDSTAV
jgi:hypothetical protein